MAVGLAMLAIPWWAEAVVALLLAIGGLVTLIGAIGLLRFEDYFQRLHAPTKATTLGVGSVLAASILLGLLEGRLALTELLITLFLFLAAPVSANLLALAGLHRRLSSIVPAPPEPPQDH